MTEADVDAQLMALFDTPLPAPDPVFAGRVIALAAFDQRERQARRRLARRIVSEALAATAVLGTFALLARAAPVAVDLGGTIPLASPALLGVAVLVLWALTGLRPAAVWR